MKARCGYNVKPKYALSEYSIARFSQSMLVPSRHRVSSRVSSIWIAFIPVGSKQIYRLLAVDLTQKLLPVREICLVFRPQLGGELENQETIHSTCACTLNYSRQTPLNLETLPSNLWKALQKNRPDLSGNIVVAVFGFIRCRLRFLTLWFAMRKLFQVFTSLGEPPLNPLRRRFAKRMFDIKFRVTWFLNLFNEAL